MKFRFIAAEKAHYPVALLCGCLGVSRSGFYAWRMRRPSQRAETDARLTAQLRVIHADSLQTYGRPRLYQALRARGIAESGRRVARLMRAAGLRARGRRRFVVTTDSAHRWPIAPDRVRRRFTPRRLNRVWAADITACRTQHGWCYVAVILDLASRRIVGWAVRDTPTLDLVITALRQAVPRLRRPAPLIHHSDRGIQYASPRFRALLAHLGIRASMSRRANCWDNAVVESFFSSFKAEAIPGRPWTDRAAATAAIGEYVNFYNDRRLHSTLGYRSPSAFERETVTAT